MFSARYAGVGATDEQNNQRLLAELVDVPLAQRGAQYACHVALADPGGAVRAESSGACRGRLLFEPRGANGFGYDPLFEVIELHETFGRLGPAVKQALSHRARALRGILPPMKRLAESGAWGRVESFVG